MTLITPGTDLFACAELVQKGDPERFVTVMAAPLAARAVLFPIYAFNVEVARAPWVTTEPMIAEMRLQWWRDALDEIASAKTVRRHEVVTPLAAVLSPDMAQMLDGLIEARRLDIEKAPFDDAEALWRYLEMTGGGLMQVAAAALGDSNGQAARGLGTATGLVSYLQAVPDLVARAKLPLPDGRTEALVQLAQQGMSRLSDARAHQGAVPRAARAAMLPGALCAPLLRRVIAQPECVVDGALALSEAGKRARRAWVGMTGRW